MSELKEFENRLSAAMDRLEAGFENAGSGGDDAGLAQELEAVRETNAALEQSLGGQQEKLASLDSELQHLREVNAQLVDNNRALREACETGQVDAALVNKAMLTELEALRAQRATEKAEAEAALASVVALASSVREDA